MTDLDQALAAVVALDPRAYFQAPMPDGRDAQIAAVVRAGAALPEAERAQFSRALRAAPLVDRLWQTFVRRQCALAVRERSEQRLRDALLALALEGCTSRELYMELTLAERSAGKLGLDGGALLREAAALALPDARDQLMRYAALDPSNKQIEVHGWHEVQDDDGFNYRRRR